MPGRPRYERACGRSPREEVCRLNIQRDWQISRGTRRDVWLSTFCGVWTRPRGEGIGPSPDAQEVWRDEGARARYWAGWKGCGPQGPYQALPYREGQAQSGTAAGGPELRGAATGGPDC